MNNTGVKVGYIRVSTKEQNTARQDNAFSKLELDKIFTEKISGKNRKRPQLEAMLSYIREGDSLYIESLSRLGRSTKDLINIVEELEAKNVQIISLKENIDTNTPAGKLMFHIFASLAEFERDTIKQRQAEGIEEAKKLGKFRGRKKITIDEKMFEKYYNKWKIEKEITAVQARKELGLKRNTFYRRVADYERKKGIS
jgi:DNA invertase Pin-like site-specific DNA recombinase